MTVIKGHSGCQLELIGDKVHKYAGKFYSKERLYKQFLKQVDFLGHDYEITTPAARWVNNHIEMDFVDGLCWIEFCNVASYNVYTDIVQKIINFVKNNESVPIPVNLDIFQQKWDSIYSKTLLHPDVIKQWWKLREICQGISVPYGYSHGDLSLSNILIGRDQTIYFIDFLDSFFECPEQDWVKLKQSTQYWWDLYLYDQFYDRVKVCERLKEFDQELNKVVDITSSQYLLFQYFNLLRILPYTTDKNIKDKVTQWLIDLF